MISLSDHFQGKLTKFFENEKSSIFGVFWVLLPNYDHMEIFPKKHAKNQKKLMTQFCKKPKNINNIWTDRWTYKWMYRGNGPNSCHYTYLCNQNLSKLFEKLVETTSLKTNMYVSLDS